MLGVRRFRSHCHAFVAGTAAVVLLGCSAVASASAFNVSPTRIVLTPSETSVIVTLRNDSDHLLRFQLTAQAWGHMDDGRMTLSDTTDVVIYPPMVSVPAHESKRVRVGAQVAARAVEASTHPAWHRAGWARTVREYRDGELSAGSEAASLPSRLRSRPVHTDAAVDSGGTDRRRHAVAEYSRVAILLRREGQ